MAGLYATDGSLNVTVVDGTTITGRYASDGSLNVVVASGTLPCGFNHPCGAIWVTVRTTGPGGFYAPDGSLYVEETPYTYSGAWRVTAVSGSLSGGAPSFPDNSTGASEYLIIFGL